MCYEVLFVHCFCRAFCLGKEWGLACVFPTSCAPLFYSNDALFFHLIYSRETRNFYLSVAADLFALCSWNELSYFFLPLQTLVPIRYFQVA